MKKIANTHKKMARLIAVQSAFQAESSQEPIVAIAQSLIQSDFSMVFYNQPSLQVSTSLFSELINGLNEHQKEIDQMIESNLAEGWTMNRIDPVSLAILRIGLYELLFMLSTPAVVAVSEYSDIAHAFFDSKDAGFVNGLLNNVARAVRKSEFLQ